jgi:hypothetical protein
MKNYWSWALGLSIFIHAAVLGGLPYFFKGRSAPKVSRELKMIPHDIEKIVENKDSESFKAESPKSVPPYVDNFIKKVMVDNQELLSLDKLKIVEDNAKEIIVANIPKDKNLRKIPAYMDYYERVRERIKSNAYYYYNNCRNRDRGKVFVDFVVLNNGRLGSVTLKEITLRSVKEAGPFLPFTEELADYVRLPFNTSINFDIEFENN